MNIFINFSPDELQKAERLTEKIRTDMTAFKMNLRTDVPNKNGDGTHCCYYLRDESRREY